jgi:hypothetical protein
MEIMITLQWKIKIEEDRADADEIARAVERRLDEAKSPVGQAVVEAYQERIVQTLCSPSGSRAKKGLGGHAVKGEPRRSCPYRSFRKAGFWTEDRHLRTSGLPLRFRPALVECRGCHKRLTPILDALALPAHQTGTVQRRRTVIEAVLGTSYRRAVEQPGLGVSKSTAHRWASGIEWPVRPGVGLPFLGADGMKFKHQGGTRGEARLVAQMGRNGRIRPLGVWAGIPWKQIASQVRRRLPRRASQFISDGEPAIERWFRGLARRCGRCLWHLRRESRYALWADHVGKEERKEIRRRLNEIVKIKPPVGDGEPIRPRAKQQLRQQIATARQSLQTLQKELVEKGYAKTTGYLAHAQDKLFSHLELWLATGRLGLKTTSWMEGTIRELARRLKKVGWNWSDAGAQHMGRMVLLHRYDPKAWQEYWQGQIGRQGRCHIHLVTCKREAA